MTTTDNLYVTDPDTVLYLFNPATTLPKPKTWLICRASAWPLPRLLDEAVKYYHDLNKQMPAVIRVHPKNLKATQEHFAAQKWTATEIDTCAGVLACEVELPAIGVG